MTTQLAAAKGIERCRLVLALAEISGWDARKDIAGAARSIDDVTADYLAACR